MWEWNDTIYPQNDFRGVEGGYFLGDAGSIRAWTRNSGNPSEDPPVGNGFIGIRVTSLLPISDPSALNLSLHSAIELTFNTYPGRTYNVEYTPDLSTWQQLPEPAANNIVGDGTEYSVLISTRNRRNSEEFYRVTEVPSP